MERRAYERMERAVLAIHRALTGEDPQLEDEGTSLEGAEAREDAPPPADDELERRFTDLALEARSFPSIAEKLSSLGFAPAVDVVEQGDEVLVEAHLPGVDARDVDVHVKDQLLLLTGTSAGDGRVYASAEIPRGPFHRVVQLPCTVSSGSRVVSDRGVLRILLRKHPQPSAVVSAEE